MPEALRPFVLLLVLENLAFVQLTGAVHSALLLPLWLLAVAAPFLVRFHDHRANRLAWNGGILIVFALLLHHVRTTGLLHMLEDGLLLATLCQVHLLHNVGTKQRPDLLFFNSFLIAFVTSFFSPDFGWSVVFFAWAATLLPALQVFTVVRAGAPVPAGLVPAVLRDAAPRTFAALLATAFVFALWPRNFDREGFIANALALADGGSEVGFAERIRLGHGGGPVVRSDVEVFRVRTSGGPNEVPSHWRGITFSEFDGLSWTPNRLPHFLGRVAEDPKWRGEDDTFVRDANSPSQWFRVRLAAANDGRLFLPLDACAVAIDTGGLPVESTADGVLQFAPAAAPSGGVEYRVRTGTLRDAVRAAREVRAALCKLPRTRLPAALFTLAQRLRSELPEDADTAEVAEHFRRFLYERRRYALPGEDGFAATLDAFVVGSGAGHCEYFATALALLLRAQDVPCRVVGGYLAAEWDEDEREVVVRRRHAHAWVEVLLPSGRWLVLDATPAATLAENASASWWDDVESALGVAWRAIAGFDRGSRDALLAWLRELPGRAVAFIASHPLRSLLGCALLAAVLWLRRRRLLLVPGARLRRAARRAGLRLLAAETPRELLARASQTEIAGERLLELERAVAAHERERYAPAGLPVTAPARSAVVGS